LVTVVPFLSGVFVDVQHLSQDQCQAGDRHLKFHEIRDNLHATSRGENRATAPGKADSDRSGLERTVLCRGAERARSVDRMCCRRR